MPLTTTNSVVVADLRRYNSFGHARKTQRLSMGTSELLILKRLITKNRLKMNPESGFTKVRWLLTVIGLGIYVGDIFSDILLGAKYLLDGDITWGILTVLFVLCASVCTQVFSYRWFLDDKTIPFSANESCVSLNLITGLHIMHMGVFTRYFQLLKRSFHVVWSKCTPGPTEEQVHLELFGLATDLSMLRLFESFLESVPQLLLQLYIILLGKGHGHASVLQYISMVTSFFSVAWAMVDYRRCLRRSLVHLQEMPSGLPTVVYLLYKLFAISTRIFSLSLLLALSPLHVVSIGLVWLLGTVWAFVLKTNFCTSRALEVVYRAIIGVVLVFSFFNVSGKNTRVPMTVYYVVYVLHNLSAPLQLYVFKPDVLRFEYATAAIATGLCLGLSLLCVYYIFLHPREQPQEPLWDADEVDGTGRQETDGELPSRIRHFLQM